jgi:hypothetical protein
LIWIVFVWLGVRVSVQDCERGRCISVSKICGNEQITTNECQIIFILDENIITTQFETVMIQEELTFHSDTVLILTD